MNILAIDIGGTFIKSDVYDEYANSKSFFKEIKTEINYLKSTNNILNQVMDLITLTQQTIKLDGVAISSAGVVDNTNGEIIFAGPTIPNYTGCKFKETIEKQFNLPTTVENDVNCALLAEMYKGAALGYNNAFMITIGTGIGGAISSNANILTGSNFSAGEVGYLNLKGQRFEEVASTSSIVKKFEVKKNLENQNGKLLFEAYYNNDKDAIEIIDEFVDNIALGLVNALYLLNPDIVIIGGGIMAQGNLLIPKIENALKDKLFNLKFMPKKIIQAKLDNNAGRIGALKHFLNTYNK